MRDPKTHELALRAALQVARGGRKKTAAAVTGLAMLTGCSGDEGATSNVTSDTPSVDSGSSSATDAVQALVDAMDAAATQDAGPAQADAAGTEDVAATDDGSTPPVPDAAPPAPDAEVAADAQPADDASPEEDAGSDCITYCYQPTETACTTTLDCEKAEVLGTCSGSGEACSWFDAHPICPVTVPEVMGECSDGTVCGAEAPCDPEQAPCEGWEQAQYEECLDYVPPVVVNVDSESGVIQEEPWNVICVDGFCHEGNQVSAAAMACCFSMNGEEAPVWCEGYNANFEAGCMAWGPPAPPAYDGTTLADRMQRWLS